MNLRIKGSVTRTVLRKAITLASLVSLASLGTSGIVGQRVSKSDAVSLTPTVTFTNPNPITWGTGVPNNGSLYPSTITVSGAPNPLPSTPDAIKVTINNFSHTFPDDLGVVLVGPTGAALLLQDGAGDDPDMSGVTYSFSDAGAAQLPEADAWGPGTYKPTTYFTGDSFPAPGPGTVYGNPGPAGSGTATFASTFGGTNPNGDWKLYTRDFVTGDGGSMAGGWTIEFSAGAVVNTQHVSDYNGDGKTDFAVVRNISGTSPGQIRWFINLNGSATTFASDWGLSTDFFVPEDYDGDQKTDIAVWRAGAPTQAAFYILQSQTNTVRIVPFGQSGDDPTVVGDYDGDGKADPAVYREGASAGQQSTWFFLGSNNNPSSNVTFVPWGLNGDFPAPGDYDGDGKNDFVIQRNNGGGQARFWMFQTTAGFDSVVYGTPTDLVVPGDYDGDGKTDLAVARAASGTYVWFFRPSSTGVVSGAPAAIFGNSATDFVVQGEYDGDGKTDFAVWRPSATGGASAFWVNGTSSGVFAVPFGAQGDYPPANFNSH